MYVTSRRLALPAFNHGRRAAPALAHRCRINCFIRRRCCAGVLRAARALPALRAISDRRSGLRALARALPPFRLISMGSTEDMVRHVNFSCKLVLTASSYRGILDSGAKQMTKDLLTTIIGTAPTFFGVLFVVWQIGRVQDQLNKRMDDMNKRIDDMRDTLRAEIRAAIAEAKFK
jgi:hypothetical protein